MKNKFYICGQLMTKQCSFCNKSVLWAWILLLAFLPQLIVKTFHYHGESVVDRVVAIAFSDRSGKASPMEHHRPADRHSHPVSQHKGHHDDSRPDRLPAHECSICQYLLSPCLAASSWHFHCISVEEETPFFTLSAVVVSRHIDEMHSRGSPQI